MNVRKIPIKDFHKLNYIEYRQYVTIGKAMAPNSNGMADVMQWKFGVVKEIQRMFRSEINIDAMILICQMAMSQDYDVKEAGDINEWLWYDAFGLFNHIENEIIKVLEIEKQLETEATPEQSAAGIDQYHSFDYFATLDRLCGSGIFHGMNYKQVMDTPYEICFLKMKLNKIDAEYQDNYIKIMSRRK